MRKRIFYFFFILSAVLFLAACGNASDEVPESVWLREIDDCDYAEFSDPSIKCTQSAIHNVDKTAHTDLVVISLQAESTYGKVNTYRSVLFQYDKSSDLWSVLKRSDWSERAYSFNDNLEGGWHYEEFGNAYDIWIESVDDGRITLEVQASLSAYDLFTGTIYCNTYAYDSFDIKTNAYIEDIPLELSDGFFVSWSQTKSGENETTTYLRIQLDIANGIGYAYVYPEVLISSD